MKCFILNLAIFVYILNIGIFQCECGSYPDAREVALCGKVLMETLSTICKGRYAESKEKKSNTYPPSLDYYKNSQNEVDDYYKVQFPFALKSSRYQFFKNRVKRGVAFECCTDKPCTYPELMSYCKPAED